MIHFRFRRLLVLMVAPLVALCIPAAAAKAATTWKVVNVPTSIADNCSTDVTSALNTFLASLTSGEEAVFPAGGCYLANTGVLLTGKTNVWVNGNGSTIRQTTYSGGVVNIFRVAQTSSSQLTNLTIQGPSGTGSASTEGDYGLKITGDTNLAVTSVTVENVEGDGMALYVGNNGALNQNVTISNSTVLNSGYHNVTLEAVNGVTFNNDTFNGCGMDSFDLEVDGQATKFVNGQPTVVAQDNVTIENSYFTNIKFYWIVSYNSPGVQENNLQILNNTLHGFTEKVGLRGSQAMPNSGLTMSGNVSDTPTTGVYGGSVLNLNSSAPIWLVYENNVNISGNTFPTADGSGAYANHPYMPAIQVYGNAGVSVKSNKFNGARVPVAIDPIYYPTNAAWTGTASSQVTQCANAYGANGSTTSAAC